MKAYLTVDNVTQSFPLEGGGTYVALRDIDLGVREGEFISLIGHSGCGKSTLLNLLAGLSQASSGGILINGRQVVEPGPDRMVVFQNYSLLPWQTVQQNVSLAVNRVLRQLSPSERRERVRQSLKMVGLEPAADRYPAELSGGMKQRVAIARALSIRPSLLLLDEPFGALDALTRGNLQQQLMQICQDSGVTAVMVTHDVDEALLLSDRIVCLTNGPEARIGQILAVPFERPRNRLEVMEHPEYYNLRSELIGFLQQQRRLRQRRAELDRQAESSRADAAALEAQSSQGPVCSVPTVLRLGYLAGLDVAPLALALDRRLFDPATVQVVPVSFATWERLELALRDGGIDAAITPATTPLRLSLGLDGRPAWPAITPMTVSRNGNALCLARHLGDLGVEDRDSLREWLVGRERPFRVAVPQRQGMTELLLRHWLAAGGIDPQTMVRFEPMAPLAMQGALRNEQIDAFIAGRYRVAAAVHERQGLVLATDREIWEGHPEKVLTCHEGWAAAHPEALLALCAGLMRAAERCDDSDQREAMVQVLSQPQWLGSQAAGALSRPFSGAPQGGGGAILRFNHFHADRAHVSNPAEGCWILSQLSRWGWCPFPSNRVELLSQVYRPDLCDRALALAGFAVLPLPRGPLTLADGPRFDQDAPLNYLQQLPGHPSPPVQPVPLSLPDGSPAPASSLPIPR